MYRDAKEELKRLEEALLEEDTQPEEDIVQWNLEDALSDIPDLPKAERKDKKIRGLTVTVIALAAVVVGVLVFLFVRYGGVFL